LAEIGQLFEMDSHSPIRSRTGFMGMARRERRMTRLNKISESGIRGSWYGKKKIDNLN